MRKSNCKICGSYDYKLLNPPIKEYAICYDCGHVYQRQLHEKDYYHQLPCHFPDDYERHAIRRAEYIIDFIERKSIRDYHPRILDVGCGAGAVINAIEKLVPDSICYGYTLGKQSDPRIYQMDIESDPIPPGRFDLIMFTHVLEHFLLPIQTLTKITERLHSNGVVYVEVPSFHWGEIRTQQMLTPEHLSFFTINSLTNVLGMAGLAPIKIKESKYWGNIKVLCKKSEIQHFCIKKLDCKAVLRYHSRIKLLYPWYRAIKRIRKIGPNE